MENKLTDNEIIKALECCPLDDIGGCRKIDALDLINRQKSEIERLTRENQSFADIGKLYSEIKFETIKEFAERLKEMPSVTNCEYEWFHLDIDNLVKEMTEREEGEK